MQVPDGAASIDDIVSAKHDPSFERPVGFLSKALSQAETSYWPTEMECAGITWSLQKLEHLVLSLDPGVPCLVYTDHSAAVDISKQTASITRSSSFNNQIVLPIEIEQEANKGVNVSVLPR